LEARVNAVLTAAVILSMALTPLAVLSPRWLIPPEPAQDIKGLEASSDIRGTVLLMGFGTVT
jgi:glutathione-regulated potassium-efflux system protein KefB